MAARRPVAARPVPSKGSRILSHSVRGGRRHARLRMAAAVANGMRGDAGFSSADHRADERA